MEIDNREKVFTPSGLLLDHLRSNLISLDYFTYMWGFSKNWDFITEYCKLRNETFRILKLLDNEVLKPLGDDL